MFASFTLLEQTWKTNQFANSYQDTQAKHGTCVVMAFLKASTCIIPLSEHQFGKDRNKCGRILKPPSIFAWLHLCQDALSLQLILVWLKPSMSTRACEQEVALSVYRGPHPSDVPSLLWQMDPIRFQDQEIIKISFIFPLYTIMISIPPPKSQIKTASLCT